MYIEERMTVETEKEKFMEELQQQIENVYNSGRNECKNMKTMKNH